MRRVLAASDGLGSTFVMIQNHKISQLVLRSRLLKSDFVRGIRLERIRLRAAATWGRTRSGRQLWQTAWVVFFIASPSQQKIVESGGSKDSYHYQSDTSSLTKPRISTPRTRRGQRENKAKVSRTPGNSEGGSAFLYCSTSHNLAVIPSRPVTTVSSKCRSKAAASAKASLLRTDWNSCTRWTSTSIPEVK